MTGLVNPLRRFGRELAAAGVCVVSGLARGVDAAAHEGATIAQIVKATGWRPT